MTERGEPYRRRRREGERVFGRGFGRAFGRAFAVTRVFRREAGFVAGLAFASIAASAA